MSLLRIDTISHVIAHTSHGDICLMLRKGEYDYQLTLDSVPIDSDIHDEVMDLIYPTKPVIPQVQTEQKPTAPTKKSVKK